jgi:hypothetical protein
MSASQSLLVSGWQALQRGKLDEATQLIESAVKLDRAARDKRGLVASLNGLAGIRRFQSRFGESLALLAEVEALARELGDPQELVNALGNRAALLREIALAGDDPSRIPEALALVEQSEAVCLRHQLLASLQFAYGTRSLLQRDLGDLEAAHAAMESQLAIARKIGKQDELARCLANMATLAVERREPSEANALLAEAEALASKLRLAIILEQVAKTRALLRFLR